MSKKELFKKYQEILLKTNGGVDDYVVALCQISNLIKDYAEEKDQQICDLEAKLKALQNGIIDDKTLNMLVKEHKLYKDLETKLAESESKRKSLEEKIKFLTEETEENFVDGQKYNQLKHQLEKSEKLKESYRLQNEQHHLQLLQFYSRLGVEAFGADIHEKALETLMIMKEELVEKKGLERALSACNRQNDEFSDMIKKLVNEKEELKQQLAEKEKEMSIKSIIRTLVKYNNLNCTFRDKTNSQIQQCGDVYNSNYGYFNFEDDYDECLNNRNDSRFDIISIDLDNQDKISFAIEQLEKVLVLIQNAVNIDSPEYDLVGLYDAVSNQIKQLKEMK